MIEKQIKNEAKGILNFAQMMENFKNVPEPTFLWSGITEGSMGLIFGPSKTGKTIFCENLAMRLSTGQKSHFGHDLPGIPQKVLFLGLEEDWRMRAKRNKDQAESMTEEEQKLLKENYWYQDMEFPKHIITKENWNLLRSTIEISEAKTVFIDSITRLNHGKLEDGSTAEEILSNLRSIAYDLNITLLCIHHTPKMEGRQITMDCIKGSAVFAQESDFAIGLNILNDRRYVKDVFFRYAPCNDAEVRVYSIEDDCWLNHIQNSEEGVLLRTVDRRFNNEPREVIKGLVNSSTDTTYKTNELVTLVKEKTQLKDRRIKELLTELSEQEEIQKISHGEFASVNFIWKGGRNE